MQYDDTSHLINKDCVALFRGLSELSGWPATTTMDTMEALYFGEQTGLGMCWAQLW